VHLVSVNFVAPRQDVVTEAVRVAVELTHNSPDAVQSSRKAIWDVADSLGVEDAFGKHVWRPENARVYSGTNLQAREHCHLIRTTLIYVYAGGCHCFRRGENRRACFLLHVADPSSFRNENRDGLIQPSFEFNRVFSPAVLNLCE
jgi:hypothetical protein